MTTTEAHVNDEPAFPVDCDNQGSYVPGMTIRDWFAGMALSSVRWDRGTNYLKIEVARGCYEVADIMLKVKGKA